MLNEFQRKNACVKKEEKPEISYLNKKKKF